MRKIKLALGILWSLAILIMCVMPAGNLPETNITIPYFDKIVHLGIFGILSFILVSILKEIFNYKKSIVITIIICSIYGYVIELLQKYVSSGRSYEILDVLFDIIGCIFGILFYKLTKKFFVKKYNLKF